MLVVEDERRLAAAVKRGLEASGFAVDLAFDGVSGLHMAREGGYDGVVLDIMLPGMSGYKVCERLRAEENWVPVLFLSAKDGEYDQADGLDLGADDYLTKPFSYVVLAARLRALLRRGAVPRPAVLRAGDLSLDPASRAVRRGSAGVELTAREFSLLEYLMRRCGRGGVQGRAARARLGRPGRDRGPQRRRGVRRVPAAEDRRAVRAQVSADRARGRVPAGGRRWLARRAAQPAALLAVDSQIVNQARAEFVAQSLDTPLTAQSGQVVTSVDAPDLTVAKSHAPQFLAGAATTFTLTVSNIGTVTSDGSLVTVSDPFPSGAAGFDSILVSSAPGWSCGTVATTLTCTRSDTLAAGAAYPAIQIGAMVHNPEPGTIANTATVSGGGDSVAGNNSATDAGPTTSEADLDLTKTVDHSVVPSGGQVTFQLTVLNRGPSTATAVTIDDPLGGAYTNITVDTSQGACTTAVHCDLGDLAANTTATVTITATVAASDTTLTNTATTASATADPSAGNNSATAGFVVPASADLTLTKTLTASPAAANPTAGLADGAVYTLTVRNLGPDTATTVDVTDPLPALFTPSAVTAPGFSCNLPPAGGTLVCTKTSLTVADGAQTITITGTLAAAAAGTVVENGAWINASERDPDPDRASAADATLVIPSADLALTKFASSPSAQPGDQVTFTLTLTNDGPSPAQNVTITDPIPSGLQFVSVSPGCTFAAGTVTCTLATLASGATATLTVTTSPTGGAAGQTLTNTATVTSTTPDAESANNVASETLEVSPAASTPAGPAATPEADLAAAVTISPTSVAVGGEANLTAVVSNRGPTDATGVTLTTSIPAGLEIVSAPAGCTRLAGSVTCSVASLPVGESMSFVIVVRPTSAAAGQTLTSSVTVAGSQPDPDDANNSATATLAVAALVDLELKESHSPLAADSTGTIATVITNHGPDTATDVVFTTTLPAGITELSAQTSEGSCSHSGRHVSCELGPLAAGSSDRIVLDVHIAEDLRDRSIEIQATVTAAQNEANPAHTNATFKAQISEGAAIASTLTARETSVKGGGTVHYTLVVRSTGRLPALHVRVCARLPQYQVYKSTPGATFRNGEACWTVSALPVGHTRRFAFTATAAHPPSTRLSTTREQATAANAQADNATVNVKIVSEPARGGGATG